MITAIDDRTAKVWDAFLGRELVTLRGHSDGLTSVALSPDGRRLATASKDNVRRRPALSLIATA